MIIPTFDVEFTKDGQVFNQAQLDALLAGAGGATDLIVLSHGWNNDMQDARELYGSLLANLEKVRAVTMPNDARQLVVAQLFWPSKKFTDEQLIPGGGAASATAANDDILVSLLDALGNDPDRLPSNSTAVSTGTNAPPADRQLHVDSAKALTAELDSPQNRAKYLSHLRALLDPIHANEEEDGSVGFFNEDPESLFARLKDPIAASVDVTGGGAANIGANGGPLVWGMYSVESWRPHDALPTSPRTTR